MSELVRVTEARAELAEAETPQQAKVIEDKYALLAKALAKHDGDLERANEYAEAAVEAAVTVGGLLPPGRMGRPPKGEESPPPAAEFSEGEVTRYRKLGASDPAVRADYYREARESGDTINKTALLRVIGGAHVSHNSGENEWYTPSDFIEAARSVMGQIELDPASSPAANETVKATRFFTAADDGLAQEWDTPALWMNPPYSKDLIGGFIEKLAAEYSGGGTSQAIVLVNNATDSKWGQLLLSVSSAVCFPAGRIRFIDQDGHPSGAPLQGQMIAYCGTESGRFSELFSRFGTVVYR